MKPCYGLPGDNSTRVNTSGGGGLKFMFTGSPSILEDVSNQPPQG